MTSLEEWAFICIVSVFVSLLFYAMILFKDQMIIQVIPMHTFNEQFVEKRKKDGGESFFFLFQGVILNDEGEAIEVCAFICMYKI